MPNIRRRAKRRNDYTVEERKLLSCGVSLVTRFGTFHNGRGDKEALRLAWNDLRDEIMEEWIAANPFSRPWAWLYFDATEPRQRTVGEQRMESQQWAKGRKLGNYRLCWFEDLNKRLGAEETRYNEGDWETERQYLARIGALTESEIALL